MAIDGKSVRGAAAGGHTRPHLLGASTHDGAIILAQRQIPDKGSEITELAALVADLDLTGTVVTVDPGGGEPAQQRGELGDLVALRADRPRPRPRTRTRDRDRGDPGPAPAGSRAAAFVTPVKVQVSSRRSCNTAATKSDVHVGCPWSGGAKRTELGYGRSVGARYTLLIQANAARSVNLHVTSRHVTSRHEERWSQVNIRDFVRALGEQWLVLLIAVVLGLGGAAAAAALQTTEYTAQITMYVTARGSGHTSSEANDGAQLAAQRVKSYVLLVSSYRVLAGVVERLKLAESPQSLASRITASSAPESVLIDIAVVDESPTRAAQVADTVSDVFSELVAQIEPSPTDGGPPAVQAQVVDPAVVPTDPSSLGLRVILAMGVLAGIIGGIAVAVLRDALDTSVKSVDQLREIAGAPPNLGTIPHDTKSAGHPLLVRDDPFSPRSEAFRQLRTKLQFLDVDKPRKVLVVTSPMPADDKTTTLLNLAIAIASAGQSVLVIDGDLRRPTVGDLLGLDGSIGLTSILAGVVNTKQAIQSWGDGPFDVLPSGPLPPDPSEMLSSLHMEALMAELRLRYDMILIDTPPLLLVTDAAAVAPTADGVILLCQHKRTAQPQLVAAFEALQSMSASLLGTVLTMVPGTELGAYGQYTGYHSTPKWTHRQNSTASLNGENPIVHGGKPAVGSPSGSRSEPGPLVPSRRAPVSAPDPLPVAPRSSPISEPRPMQHPRPKPSPVRRPSTVSPGSK